MKPEHMKLLRDRFWRLNNLYFITDKAGKKVRFRMTQEQIDYFQGMHTRNIILKARQLGFTTLVCIVQLDAALFESAKCALIAHTLNDAKRLFREKVKYAYDNLPAEIRAANPARNDASGELVFSKGGSLYVSTSFRGGTLRYLHVSEFGKICAKFPHKAREIVTGAFEAVAADCFVTIESTAEGRAGYFFDYSQSAEKQQLAGVPLGKLDWKFFFFSWWRNGLYWLDPQDVVIPQRLTDYFNELQAKHGIVTNPGQRAWYAAKEKTLGTDMKREYPSIPAEAFQQSIEGAYYAQQFNKLYANQRIGVLPNNSHLPVMTFWDIGVGDSTAIWFVRQVGEQYHVIDYYENSGEGLRHYMKVLKDKGYTYSEHWGPHDIDNREFGSDAKTRRELAREGYEIDGQKYCMTFQVVPKLGINDGIEQVREILPKCAFDESKCEEGISCLENYRKEWDDKKGCWKDKPLHDWTSHGSDAFRYFAVAKSAKEAGQINQNGIRPMSDVTFQRPEFKAAANRWRLVRDVCKGSETIKAAGDLYLPRPNSTDESIDNRARYDGYKARAVFYNATGRTKHSLVGAVFRTWPTLDVPGVLDYVAKDVDGQGVSIYQQSQSVIGHLLEVGRHGLLVDYPSVDGNQVSKADNQSGGIRPTITSYPAESIINWKTMQVGGQHLLSLVVLREVVDEDTSDGFGSEQVVQFRVLRLTDGLYTQEVWQEGKSETSQTIAAYPVTDGAGLPWRMIPFQFLGSENNDSSIDDAPLYDMAEINIGHYRNSADYEDSAYFAGQPQFWIAGLDEQWRDHLEKNGIYVGSRAPLTLPKDGSCGFAQPEPNTLVKEAMDAKKEDMVSLGARLIERGSAVKTATQADNDSAAEHSVLSLVVSNVSEAYCQCLVWMALFVNVTGDAVYKLNQDFSQVSLDANILAQLFNAVQGGRLPATDFWQYLRDRGVIDPEKSDDDIRDELETAAAGPKLDDEVTTNGGNPGVT